MLKIVLLLSLLLAGPIAKAQVNDSVNIGIDVLVSKDIVKGTELAKSTLINDVDVSTSQSLVLASNDCFFCIGYGDYYARRVSGKKISTFCVIDNDVYYCDKSTLYKIGTDNKESKVMRFSFVPRKIWSGKQVIYAVSKKGKKEEQIYAVFPEQKEAIPFYSSSSSIVGIDEYGPFLIVLTEKAFVMIDVRAKEYEEFPVNIEETGKLLSLAVDQSTGSVYISSVNGIYRVFEEQFQKICSDVGILCYDIDGMLIFNNKDPFIIRLRHNLLYPIPDGVIIEIK